MQDKSVMPVSDPWSDAQRPWHVHRTVCVCVQLCTVGQFWLCTENMYFWVLKANCIIACVLFAHSSRLQLQSKPSLQYTLCVVLVTCSWRGVPVLGIVLISKTLRILLLRLVQCIRLGDGRRQTLNHQYNNQFGPPKLSLYFTYPTYSYIYIYISCKIVFLSPSLPLALYPGLLTPAFVACSTNAGCWKRLTLGWEGLGMRLAFHQATESCIRNRGRPAMKQTNFPEHGHAFAVIYPWWREK